MQQQERIDEQGRREAARRKVQGIVAEQSVAFYRTTVSSKEFRFAYADTVARNEAGHNTYYRAREFRPKTFRVNIGYDGDRIEREAKPGDIDDSDPMVGIQYRIGVAGDVDEKLVSMTRSEILSKLKKQDETKDVSTSD